MKILIASAALVVATSTKAMTMRILLFKIFAISTAIGIIPGLSGCRDNSNVATNTAANTAAQNTKALREQFMTDAKLHVHFEGQSMELPLRMSPKVKTWLNPYILPTETQFAFELTDPNGNPHPDAGDVTVVLGDWGSQYGIISTFDVDGNLDQDRSVRVAELLEYGTIPIGEKASTSRLRRGEHLTLVSKKNHDVYITLPFLLSSFMHMPQEFPGLRNWTITTPSQDDEYYEIELTLESPNEKPLGEGGDYIQQLQIIPKFRDGSSSSELERKRELFYPMHPGKRASRVDNPKHGEVHDITSSLHVDDGRAVLKTRFLLNLSFEDLIQGFEIAAVDQRDENRVLTVIIPVPNRPGTLTSADVPADPRAEAYFNSPGYQPPRFYPASKTENGMVVEAKPD